MPSTDEIMSEYELWGGFTGRQFKPSDNDMLKVEPYGDIWSVGVHWTTHLETGAGVLEALGKAIRPYREWEVYAAVMTSWVGDEYKEETITGGLASSARAIRKLTQPKLQLLKLYNSEEAYQWRTRWDLQSNDRHPSGFQLGWLGERSRVSSIFGLIGRTATEPITAMQPQLEELIVDFIDNGNSDAYSKLRDRTNSVPPDSP